MKAGKVSEWIESVKAVDSSENILVQLERLEQTFLESDDANDKKTRIESVWLFQQMKLLFK